MAPGKAVELIKVVEVATKHSRRAVGETGDKTMRSEEEIKRLEKGMDEHKNYIRDDFQRFGFDNFQSALRWVLGE